MWEVVQGLHWDVTQGRKGHKCCLQIHGVRLTPFQTMSLGMLPSLGLWPQCQHNQVGLCCGDSPVLAQGIGLGETSGVLSLSAQPQASPASVPRLRERWGALP